MRKIVTAVGILVLLTAGMAQAQTREGRWIGFGISIGSLGRDGLVDVTVPVGHAGIGVYIAERVMLAGEVSYWRNEVARLSSTTQYSLGPMVYLYPSGSVGFFLKVGAGVARQTQENSLGKWSDTGVALSVGLGVEISIGEHTALRPFVDAGMGGALGIWTLKELGVGVSFR